MTIRHNEKKDCNDESTVWVENTSDETRFDDSDDDPEQPPRRTTEVEHASYPGKGSTEGMKANKSSSGVRTDYKGGDVNSFCIVICLGSGFVIAIILVAVLLGGSGGGDGGGGSSFVAGSGGRGSSCFPAGESVMLADGSADIPIEQLMPGTLIRQGRRVLANMKLAANAEEDPLYRYNNAVYVTGSHLVEEKGTWKPVSDSDLAISHQFGEDTPSLVYNLITEDHKLMINNTLFADWEEWENTVENWALETAILKRLNNGHIDPRLPSRPPTDPVGEGAFASSTMVRLSDGNSIPMEDVQPGQQLHDDDGQPNYVFAVMQLYIPDDTVICRYRNTVATEWTIVQDDSDHFWRNLKYSSMEGASVIGLAKDYQSVWYQLWTTTHKVPIGSNHTFADYHILDEDDPIFFTEEEL